MRLTHDVSTLVSHALTRIGAGQATAGVLIAPRAAPVSAVVEDLELIDAASEAGGWAARVIFLTLR